MLDISLAKRMLDPYQAIIKKCADEFSISENLIGAVILTESSAREWAPRFEELFKYIHMPSSFANKLSISLQTEIQLQKFSWGPMQIMGGSARDIGFDDHIPKLCLPDIGIFWGCKKLNILLNKYSMEDAISSYNQGNPRKNDEGAYENQKYVDKVLGIMRMLSNDLSSPAA